jgi:hypothetical protein
VVTLGFLGTHGKGTPTTKIHGQQRTRHAGTGGFMPTYNGVPNVQNIREQLERDIKLECDIITFEDHANTTKQTILFGVLLSP